MRCGEIGSSADDTHRSRVRYVRIPARARSPLPDSIVYLLPGPDANALSSTEHVLALFDRARSRRDVVLLELVDAAVRQRTCTIRSSPESVADYIEPARQITAFEKCVGRLGDVRAIGAHLAIERSVSTLEALRIGLQAPRLNLFGQSRGAVIARSYAARHPERVRLLALDDTPSRHDSIGAARNAVTALAALIERCVNDPDCASMHSGLARQLKSVLSAPARRVALVDPVTGSARSVRLDANAVRGLLLQILRHPEDRQALPAAIASASAGDYRGLIGLASLGWQHVRSGRLQYLSYLALCDGEGLSSPADAQDAWGLIQYAQSMHARRCGVLNAAGVPVQSPVSRAPTGTVLPGWLTGSSGLRQQCLADVVHRLVENPAQALSGSLCGEDTATPAWPLPQVQGS